MGNRVNVTQGGKTFAIDESQLDEARRQGFTVEGEDQAASRIQKTVNEERFDNAPGKVVAGGLGLARGATLGLSDVALRAAGVEGSELETIRDVNPVTSTITEIGGALASGGTNLPGGLASKLGARVARTAEGASTATQIGRAAAGAAPEGFLFGAGAGATDLALSCDEVTLERAASVIGSNALFGAATGGVVGGAGKAVEKGLGRAKRALDEFATSSKLETGDIAEDLLSLDRKGLRTAEKTEMEAIEAARVPKRAELADEIKALRSEMKEQKIWLATKDADAKAIKEVREVGKTALEADRAIDRMLRNPKALAERPQRVLDGLQQQEHALETLVKQGDNLRPLFTKDTTGARAAALDYASVALEKNRALQGKIAELTAKPTSSRLEAIAEAADRLTSGGTKKESFAEQMLGGSIFGHVAGAFSGIPVLGPMIGAKAAKLATGLVSGKLGAATQEAAARASQAIDAVFAVGQKVGPRARVAATKVLSQAAYAPRSGEDKKHTLASAYKERVAEIRSQVQPMPDGSVRMRPEKRAELAERLKPIAAVNPLLADRIETIKAREVEFLASKTPRKPDAFALQLGPDHWQPSDMDMRTWARYVAAVTDPHGVVERLADGSVTPEDAEAMKAVYPEMYADIQLQLQQQMGELRANLPYHRRLALSIFSGVPVDPALAPEVLTVLQASYSAEEVPEDSPGPVAKPQFGSVKAQDATPAQERSAGQ